MIQSYLKGDKIKEDLAGAKNIKTRLYEEDNQLCGEVSFDFDDITKLKVLRDKDTGPWCFYLSAFSMGLRELGKLFFLKRDVRG